MTKVFKHLHFSFNRVRLLCKFVENPYGSDNEPEIEDDWMTLYTGDWKGLMRYEETLIEKNKITWGARSDDSVRFQKYWENI
jgi:hypothetical protein